jgi:localization factor PodJL
MQDGDEPAPQAAAAPPAASAPPPRVAMARAPTALLGEAPAFERVRADVEAGQAGALAQLQALAGTGHSQARLYLAQLYDAGEAGLPRDPVEARKLTVLAAEAGEPRAMHNLGVYLFRGEGGPQDLVLAVDWFRKAAAAGIVESQYNLGLVYQSGAGVARDLSQARYWFRLAAARGDAEARKALTSLEAASAKTTSAADANSRAAPTAAREPAPSLNIRQTQLVLSRLGYYDGPVDGRTSDAYRLALNAYQTDLAASPAARR